MESLGALLERLCDRLFARRTAVTFIRATDISSPLSMFEVDSPESMNERQVGSVIGLNCETPIRTNGTAQIDVEEGYEDIKNAEENASQASECIDEQWIDIPVDTREEYDEIGGDDSSSYLCEEFNKYYHLARCKDGVKEEAQYQDGVDIVKKKSEYEEEEYGDRLRQTDDFIIEDQYIDDNLSDIVRNDGPPSTVPEERFFYPTTFVGDEEGYEWEEPVGYSIPALAPTVPKNLAYPALLGAELTLIRDVARSLLTPPKDDTPSPISIDINGAYSTTTPTMKREGTPITSPTDLSTSSINNDTIVRPPTHTDDQNEWLRSLYERAGLAAEIPEFIKNDTVTNIKHSPSQPIATCEPKSSTPVFASRSFTPLNNSLSTIASNDSSRTLGINSTFGFSPNIDRLLSRSQSLLEETYAMSHRTRAILTRRKFDAYPNSTFDVDVDD